MFGHFDVVDAFFQIVVLLFAISVHESAHAWMANRLGDPTAKMLGRVSLNPIVHIDPFGTILMPAMLILLGFPPFGWAKPTPVDNRNFRNPVRDDILTAVAGPISNFLTALVSVIVLAFILHGTTGGIDRLFRGADVTTPLAKLFYEAMRINVILAVGAELPVYAHVPNVNGQDGKKLSKRHGATGVDEFRKAGYLPDALVNFLALLGWAPDGETTIMSREELIERFLLDHVTSSPAQFDYAKLDWMNGVYIRALPEEEFAHALILWLGEQGYDWDAVLVRKAAPLVQEKIARLDEFPAYARFFFEDVTPDPAELNGGADVIAAAQDALSKLEPFTAEAIEAALRSLVEQLGLKPRQGFQPIRIAVTGSKISPGLFESIELLGREKTLARLTAAGAA